jgi:hypothetical protein
MSRPFTPEIAYRPKTSTMDTPPFAELGLVAEGAPSPGAVEGQPDATPLPAEPERYSDAFNVAAASGAIEDDPEMADALALSAYRDGLVLGADPYDPGRNPGDAVREARYQDLLARLEPLRAALKAAEAHTTRTAEALAEEGAHPERPRAALAVGVATLGLAVPLGVAFYPSVALPWLLDPAWAMAAAGVGGLLVAAATAWTLARGLPVDHHDCRQTRGTLLVGSVGMALSVGLLAATGGSGLVAAGLGILAGLGTAVATLVARTLHEDLARWEPRMRQWSARDAAWTAAQRDQARAQRELSTCESGIAAHGSHLAGRSAALRAAELRAEAASQAALAGHKRGVRANQGIYGWARAPKGRGEQIVRFHTLRGG